MIKGRHKWADAIIAWAKGEPIQYRVLASGLPKSKNGPWRDCAPDCHPNWDHKDYEYRPKPEQTIRYMALPKLQVGGGGWHLIVYTNLLDCPSGQKILKLTYEDHKCVAAELAHETQALA